MISTAHEPCDLTRVTFNATEKTKAALDEASILDGLSRTDVLNRAVQVYLFLLRAKAAGQQVYLTAGGTWFSRLVDGRKRERVTFE